MIVLDASVMIELLALSRADLVEPKELAKLAKKLAKAAGAEPFVISAATGDGLVVSRGDSTFDTSYYQVEVASGSFAGVRAGVVLDGVTDPHNLGAIVRSCDGAGVDLVVVPRHSAVHVTPTVAKAAAGAVEQRAEQHVDEDRAGRNAERNAEDSLRGEPHVRHQAIQ